MQSNKTINQMSFRPEACRVFVQLLPRQKTMQEPITKRGWLPAARGVLGGLFWRQEAKQLVALSEGCKHVCFLKAVTSKTTLPWEADEFISMH